MVAEDDPSFNYAANNYCPTGADPSAVITGTGGGTFTSVPAVIFLDAGTGEIDLSASTVGGPYSITYTTAGACPNSSNFNLSITAEDDPSFTYSAISFCQGDADPVATITGTGGGTFTGPVAVVFTDAATGEIDLEASTVGGPYTITYTTPNFCPNSTTFDISIVAEDDPSFTYTSGSYCQTGIDPVATITGTGGGTFSGPVEVVFLDAGTGEIDLSASTLGGPYVVTYTTTGTCPNSDSFDLSITDSPDAGFDYTGPYCQKGANPLPTFDPGASAGTFSATPAGLNFVNVNTGRINLTTSTPGVYKVYNTIAPSGGCAQAKDSAMVTINPIDDPSFSYTAASFCQGDADPVATITGAGGGSFSVVAQLTLLDAGTGEIDLSASTLGGPYSVTYTTVGICPNSTNHSISILAEEDPSFTYASNNFCQADADPPATITGTGGGTFTEASGNVSINAATGLIDLSASIAGGPYTITYTTPGTCSNNTTFDVTIEAEESPAFTYASNTYCQGGVDPTPTITGTGGGTFSAPIQLVIDGGTGEIDLSGCTPGGPYTVTYTTPGTCSNSTTFNITIILDDPTFHYSANSYCQGDADPSATIDGTPGGTFSEVSGNVSLNASNGLIDLSASTAGGPYTIRYSTGGMCPIGSTWDVTIVTEDDPAFTYGSNNYCQGDADPTATITGTGGGTFSAVPAVVFLDVNTGEIDVSASTIGGPYVITYTTPGVCPNSTTFNVSITGEGDPSFTYAANSFCQGDADPSATITGTTGGTFTEGSGDISLNASTGAIDLSASTVGGPYTITYTTGGFCSNSTTFDVSIMAEENPAFTYSSNKFCQGGSDPAATITGTGGGTFSAVPAVVFLDVNTGEIDVSASTAGGPYVITYTTPGTCSNATTFNLTVYAEDDASFTYTANSFCQGDADPSPTITGTGGGTFTEAGGNLSINATTGEIDLSASTAGGPYSVKYVTPGQCKDSTTWFITINAEDDPSFNYSAASYCQTGIDPVAIITGTAGGGFTEGTGTLVLDAGTGEIDLSASPLGNFIVTYTTVGICPNSQTAAVSITDGPQASFSYAQPFCQQDADPVAILDMGSQAGTFTANSGAVVFLDVNTGEIDMTATAAGTHRIYNNIAAAGGCAATKDSADITVYPIPTVSAGSDDAFCHYDTYELDGSFGGGASSIIWSVTTGGGFDNATLPGAIYTPSQIDIDNDSVVVTIITDDPVGPCVAVTDFVVLTIPAEITVDTDGDQTVCANNAVTTLNGTVSGATNTGYWSTSGTGTFAPDSTALGGTYTPSDADTAAGFVILTLHSTNNGICAEVTGTMTLTFTDGPVVYAGADDEVCANNGSYTLSGAIEGGASEGIWTTSGTGSFQPNDIDLGATYIPSDIDTAAGSVVITLTTTDHGSCNEEDHSFTLTITDAPYVSAGVDQTICADGATVTLAGVITAGSTEGYWETSGDGTFTPDSTDLLAVYTPGTNDVSAGSVTLVITSTNNDLCVAETDTMEITITTGIVVDAGIDQEVCGHDPDIELDGAVSGGTTTGEWSTSGTGDFDPDEFALDAIYRPSDADTAAGIITLVLTSTNNGLCVEVTDTLILTINDAAIVSAGSDVTVCASNADVDITADVHGSTSTGIWETSGTGTFSPHDSALTVTYIPSDADTAAGLVYLTLTTTHLENCTAVIDTVEVNITPVPLVDAGEDIFVCANMADATLDGHVAGASTTGVWTTLGTGIFSPHDSLLTATYEASTPDTTAGSVTLILTSTHNGGCLEVTDTVDIFFTEAPLANANIDQTVCANTQLQLAGSVAFGAGTGEWTTNGAGTFSPDSTDLNAVYTFSNADTAAGALTFILSTTNAAGCAPHSDTMEVTITDAPYVEAGPDVSVCENNDTVTLSGAVWGATTTGEWSTTGTGNFFADEFTLNGQYVPSDDDTLIRVFPIFLTSTVNGDCNAVTDSFELTITTMPYADAGEDLPICKGLEANLNGQIFGGSGEGTWTSSGTGTFAPNADALDAVYTPSDADTTAGLVYLYLESTDNGNCLPAYDTIAISLTELPNITAGVDQTVCANKDTVQLAGIISGATTTGFWTTEGDGEFVPADTVLDAEYIPGLEDLANGAVTLTLTATNACFAQDSMEITITPAPVVDAGADQIVCIDVSTVHLTGSITGGATAGEWTTSGTGSFIPNAQTPNADYLRSSADSALGHVTLILTTTDHGDCYPDADTMEVSMTDIPVVFAGVDKTYCSNNANITLNGSVTGQSSTGHWVSSGTGTFTPNANTLNATYKPSSADTAAHTVTLTLSSTNTCVIVSDAVTFTLTPAPLVSAGGDYTSCSNNPTLTLDGAVDAGAHTGKWYTTGTGTFLPTNTTLGATYSPTPADIASGTVYLTLISTVNGMCYPVRDTAVLTIQQAPIVDAGDDMYICTYENAELEGSVTGITTSGTWQTSGTGSFSPDPDTLDAEYVPSVADIAAGNLILTLTSTNNDACIAVSQGINLVITAKPTVTAGDDETVCANNAEISLSGSVSGSGTTGIWTSSGTGTFTPDATNLNAHYIPSDEDTATGNVQLILSSTYACLNSDTLEMVMTPAPQVFAGADQYFCEEQLIIDLSADIFGGSTTGIWTTSGSGTFSPNDSALILDYLPSSADTASERIYLYLTSTHNGDCNAVVDSLSVNFIEPPEIDAGPDQTVCANTFVVVNGHTSGSEDLPVEWFTSGDGEFNPDNEQLLVSYHFGDEDVGSDTVQLSLATPYFIGCDPRADTMNVFLTTPPIIYAGEDQSICSARDTALVIGQIWGITSTGVWTSDGDGSFINPATSLNNGYIPGPTDGDSGIVLLILTTTGNGVCLPEKDTVVVTLTKPAEVYAGPDMYICYGSNVRLEGEVSGLSTTGIWSADGGGSFSPNPTILDGSYVPIDSDTLIGTLTLILASTDNGVCTATLDTMLATITQLPFVDAGSDEDVCANDAVITLNGIVSGVTTTGEWNSTGSGTFSPDSVTLNGSYIPSDEDTAAGTIYLFLESTNACRVVDSLIVNISKAPVVNAGPDLYICGDDSTAELSGYVGVATTTGIWTTDGTGYFLPDETTLNAVYVRSSDDSLAQVVTLVLTSTVNGDCLAETDTTVIHITTVPVVDAGGDQTICANNDLMLTGSVTVGSTTGIWLTSGNGTFSPSATDLNAQYLMSMDDTANGGVTLILKSTFACVDVYDTVDVIITPAPFITATLDGQICDNDPVLQLHGSVGIATGLEWSTLGDGSFSPNELSTDPQYLAGYDDIDFGMFTIVLASTGNGLCNPVYDTLELNMVRAPEVIAGPDQILCFDVLGVSLSGQVTGSSVSGKWTASGAGHFFPSDSSLNTMYVPTVGDVAFGSVKFYLQSTHNGSCIAVMDSLTAYWENEPVVDAGDDQRVCSNTTGIQLDGNVIGVSSTGIWSSAGNGSFSPSDSAFDAVYVPSTAERAQNSIKLILTSTHSCTPIRDTVEIFFNRAPVAQFTTSNTCNNLTVNFTNTSSITTGAITGYSWNFGDSNSSTDEDPTHDYAALGDYQVSLTATSDSGCVKVITKTVPLSTIATDFAFASNCFLDAGVAFTDLTQIVNDSIVSWKWIMGDGGQEIVQNPTHEYDDPGVYSVQLIATTENGCIDTMLYQVPVVETQTDFAYTVNCLTDSVYFTDLSSATNDSIIGYTWSFGDGGTDTIQNPQYNYASGTTFTVTLITETSQGCIDSISQPIALSNVVADFEYSGICMNEGAVTFTDITTAENDSVVVWDWSFGDGNISSEQNPENEFAVSDTFTVQLAVQTQNNCRDTISKSIVLVDLDINFDYIAGCWSDSVQFVNTSTVSNDVFVQWKWWLGDGNTHEIENPLYEYTDGGNEYEVTLVGHTFKGCVDTIVQIIQLTSIHANFDYSGTCFYNTGVTLTDQSYVNSDSIVGWSWNFGDGDTDTLQNTFHTYDTLGLYDVELILLSDSGCTDTVIQTIAISEVNALFGVVSECMSSSGMVFTDSSDASFSTIEEWAWSFGDGGIDSVQNPVHIFDTSGVFDVELIITSNAGCTDTLSRSIAVSRVIADYTYTGNCVASGGVSFSDNSLAENSQISEWHWDFGDGDTDTIANPVHEFDTTGNFAVQLIVVSDMGCTDTITRNIPVSTVIANFGFDENCLNSGGVEFSDSSIAVQDTIIAWSWSFGDGMTDTVQNPVHEYDTAGDYTVQLIVTGQNGCTDTLEAIVPVYGVTSDFTYLTNCSSNDVQFSDLSTADNDSIISWSWDFGDGTSDNTQNPQHLFDTSGNYTVVLTVQTANGCSDAASLSIAVSVFNADFSYSGICNGGDNVVFTDASVIENDTIISWAWNFGDGSTANVQNPVHDYSTEMDYTVTLIIGTSGGCSDTVMQIVPVVSVDADFSYSGLCITDSVYFTDNSTVVNDVITDWTWDFDPGTDSVQNPTTLFGSAGNRDVTLIIETQHGCIDSVDVTVALSSVAAGFTHMGVCAGETITFIDTSKALNDAITDRQWDLGDGTTDTTTNVTHVYASEGSFTVDLVVTGTSGCSDSASQNIVIRPNPVAAFTWTPEIPRLMEPIFFTDLSVGATSWYWDFGNLKGNSSEQNPAYAYDEITSFTVILTITNDYGCEDTATMLMVVGGAYPPSVPTGFSPNGDGINSLLFVKGGPFSEFDFKIYNEWGKRVFETTDPSDGWDGTVNGKEQPVGVYVYSLYVVTSSGETFNLVGDITLLR
ncbi:MAG: PKD domain-containing protein [Bacteroidetes bacterium]|nr:PKD domain-containing protein [Bacteroidota bacterium]